MAAGSTVLPHVAFLAARDTPLLTYGPVSFAIFVDVGGIVIDAYACQTEIGHATCYVCGSTVPFHEVGVRPVPNRYGERHHRWLVHLLHVSFLVLELELCY
jgi:hypothetical protein